MTYTFDRSFLSIVEEELDKVNKRARKNGLEGFRLEVVSEEPVTVNRTCPHSGEEFTEQRLRVTVELHGETVQVAGWTLVGVLEHVGDGNLVREVPGRTVPDRFRSSSPDHCDHCHKIRRRNETFVLQNGTGFQQVGRTCLKDFFGHSPEHMLNYVSRLQGIDDLLRKTPRDGEPDGFGYGHYHWGMYPGEFLAYVSLVMRKDGWVSSKTAYERNTASTADTACRLYFRDPELVNQFRREYNLSAPTNEDRERAQAGLAWARTLEGTNTYLHNLRTAAQIDWVPKKAVGLVASLLATYDREIGNIKAREARTNEYFGEPGQKVKGYDLKVTSHRTFESYNQFTRRYEAKSLVVLRDRDGRTFKWWTTCEPGFGEDFFAAKFTVKTHEDYKGNLQTVITRVCEV